MPYGDLGSGGVNDGADYGGDFYWSGGISLIEPNEGGVSLGPFNSSYFGFLLVCGKSTCNNNKTSALIAVQAITLEVHETTAPTLGAGSGLWASQGWIRGDWHLIFWGNSPSGLCGIVANIDGAQLPGTISSRDPSVWHQCAAPAVDDLVRTPTLSNGAHTVQIGALDAAGETVVHSKTVAVDNAVPTVSLSGPSDAPSTAGTQYVTATAAAGPSGVDGIACSLDDGASQWTAGSTARVAVSGIGDHVVSCYSQNNALDPNGSRGTSATESLSVKIGVPTVTGIGFTKLVDQLQCRRVRERVTVPSRWVTVRWHHHLIRVRTKRRTRVLRVVKCHPRTAQRQRMVTVTIRRHGHRVRVRRRKTVRVILLPHTDRRAIRLVPHGRSTTVSGWLGTYDGTALGGQTVQILTATDDGRELFSPATAVTTAADGSWTATLPPGPSRLVEAQYGGNPLAEASLSGLAREVVPAKAQLLSVTPDRIAWGGTVRLTGWLRGGYLPPGGALVRLRIGLGSSYTTYGVHEHVGGNGRFSTTYTFGAGDPAVHRSFWFQVATLPMGNYPYAPASSRRMSVQVGGHPARRRRR